MRSRAHSGVTMLELLAALAIASMVMFLGAGLLGSARNGHAETGAIEASTASLRHAERLARQGADVRLSVAGGRILISAPHREGSPEVLAQYALPAGWRAALRDGQDEHADSLVFPAAGFTQGGAFELAGPDGRAAEVRWSALSGAIEVEPGRGPAGRRSP